MGNLYICADLNLFSSIEAGGKDKVPAYNQMIIKNWNSIVQPEDTVLLIGNVTSGLLTETKNVITQLTGTKHLIDYGQFFYSKKFSENEWLKIGINRVASTGGWMQGIVDGKSSSIVLAMSSKDFNIKADYYVAAQHLIKSKKRFDKNVLNLSIKHWGYSPVEYKSIPYLIDGMLTYERMENVEKEELK